MAQHDMNIANQGFPAFRADLNNALGALVSNSSGATAPSTTFAHQFWVDTAADPSVLKIRNADNDAWITIGEIDQTGDKFNLTCANATIAENLTLNAQGDLRFADSDSSNWVAFQAPATVASNVTWTLPAADGTADQVLKTDGSGALGWATAGGASNLGDGSATTPSVNFSADTNTGIYRPGNDRLGFATNGALVGEFDGTNLKFNSGYGSVATAYGCRAWVNFDGTTNTGGNCDIRASGNVSTVADNSTGKYTVNFTTAMPDANYSTVCSAANSSSTWPRIIGAGTSANSTYSTTAVGLYVVRPDDRSAEDNDRIQVAVFR